MKIIEMMNNYVCNNSNELMHELQCNDEKMLMVICTNLLSWLSSDYKKLKDNKFKYHKPMTLKLEYDWANKLIEFVANNKVLSSLFVINDNSLDFNPKLSKDNKIKIIEFVGNNYVPFITRY
jgi:hypothetical protein